MAVILGSLILGETVDARTVIAGAIIISAVVLIVTARGRMRTPGTLRTPEREEATAAPAAAQGITPPVTQGISPSR